MSKKKLSPEPFVLFGGMVVQRHDWRAMLDQAMDGTKVRFLGWRRVGFTTALCLSIRHSAYWSEPVTISAPTAEECVREALEFIQRHREVEAKDKSRRLTLIQGGKV